MQDSTMIVVMLSLSSALIMLSIDIIIMNEGNELIILFCYIKLVFDGHRYCFFFFGMKLPSLLHFTQN